MKFPLRQFLLVPVVVLCAREAGAQTSAAAVDTQAQATPAPSPDQEPEPSAPLDSFQLVKEGRALLKERKNEAGVAKLKDAVALGEAERRPGDEQALLHYLYSLALRKVDDEKEALAQIRRAVVLAPSEADYRLDLAQQLFERDEFEDAKREAEKALQLGLSDSDDQKDAQKLIKNAKSELLHQRFSFDASFAIDYDSNVLQGKNISDLGTSTETVAGSNTNTIDRIKRQRDQNIKITPAQKMALQEMAATTREFLTNYENIVRNIYQQPIGSPSEFDLPITIKIAPMGRVAGNSTIDFWIGYKFTQIAMTSIAKDHDAYSTQEHVIKLLANWHPISWLYLKPQIEGGIAASGLSEYSLYAGGGQARLDAVFTESRRWRTRIHYLHFLQLSTDRDSSYLDINRDEAKITQELRLRGAAVEVRASLAYRLRSERTGIFPVTVRYLPENPPIYAPIAIAPTIYQIGQFDYIAPRSYLGNEISTRLRFLLPAKVEINAGFGFEYKSYSDQYKASYKNLGQVYIVDGTGKITNDLQNATINIASTCSLDRNCTVTQDKSTPLSLPGVLELPGIQRIDNLISADIGISKELPLGFSLDLSYSLLRNISTIANGLDNRSYVKHTVSLSANYSF